MNTKKEILERIFYRFNDNNRNVKDFESKIEHVKFGTYESSRFVSESNKNILIFEIIDCVLDENWFKSNKPPINSQINSDILIPPYESVDEIKLIFKKEKKWNLLSGELTDPNFTIVLGKNEQGEFRFTSP